MSIGLSVGLPRTRKYAIGIVMLAMVNCGGGSSESGGGFNLLGGDQDPDPVTVDFPLAVIKRSLSVGEDGEPPQIDTRDPALFQPGAELILRDRASPSAAEVSLTAGVFPPAEDGSEALYDVRDLSASSDGTQLLFSMRAPEDPDLDEQEQPTWNIWLYDVNEETLTRVISSDITAEDGEDLSPSFLPDGRILFSSTRQRRSKAILLDEGKPQFSSLEEDRDTESFALHVMNADGSDIEQISFNQSMDLDPKLLSDGRIVYSRWDQIAANNSISLYTMFPDGRQQELLYGIDSGDTVIEGIQIDFVEAQELPDGRLLAIARPRNSTTQLAVIPLAIDVANYVNNEQPTFQAAGLSAPAQEALINRELILGDSPSPAGRYITVSPLFDGSDRLIATWSQCRLSNAEAGTVLPCTDENLAAGFPEAPPIYGVWVHDLVEDTQQPIIVPDEGEAFVEAIVLEPKQPPVAIADGVPGLDLDADRVAAGVGVLNIRSVYDVDGVASVPIEVVRDPLLTPAAERPARFLRLVKAVSQADDDIVDIANTAFGRSNAQLMREILGYVPIEPDGSVMVEVPANVAFYMSVVDANGRRIGPRHQNWLQIRPGEERACVGCHESGADVPHGRADAQAPSANPGAPVDGLPFPNTVAALFADAGQTMAEVNAARNGVRQPDVNLSFTDIWTDPALATPDPAISLDYTDLSSPPPTPANCVTQWTPACRIVVNYETHIHPLWGIERPEFGADGITVEANNQCNSCHSPLDAAGVLQVPAAQLDLADGPSADEADHFKAYRELLFNDNEQAAIDGALQDVLVQDTDADGNPLFEVDEDGNLLLDNDGEPIPVLITITVPSALRVNGAAASPRFFTLFQPGGSHEGYLTDVELKLISEWIDVGGQYFNNPFDVAPQ